MTVQYILLTSAESIASGPATAIPANKSASLPNNREFSVRAVLDPDPDSMLSTGYDLYGRTLDPLTGIVHDVQLTDEFFGVEPSRFGIARDGTSGGLRLVYDEGLGDRIVQRLTVSRRSTGDGADDVIETDQLIDRIDGGAGSDTVSYASSRVAVQVDLASTNPQVSTGSASGDTLVSIENANGGLADDRLAGNDLDNVLTGGRGADTLLGLAGIDTASYASSTAAVQVDLNSRGSQSSLGDAGGDVLDSIENLIGSRYGDTLTGNTRTLSLRGEAGNDTLVGGEGADFLVGGLGNDSISGSGGADTLDGGAGDDVLNGGAGLDVANYADAAAGVTVDLSLATRQMTGGGGRDTLTDIEGVVGSASADRLTGNELANALQGGMGADTLDGGLAGRDTLDGGAGDDTYRVDHSSQTIVEGVGGGSDTVRASINVTLSDNVENLILSGPNLIRGYGNGLANRITASGGIDELRGFGGNHTLVAGAGRDLMAGGAGRDLFVFESLADLAVGSNRDAIADFVRGDDLIDLRGVSAVIGRSLFFSGGSGFTGRSGEIVTRSFGQGTLVMGDADGNGRSDFEIVFQSPVGPAASDFLL